MIESAELLPKVRHRKKQDFQDNAGRGASLKMEKNRDINGYNERSHGQDAGEHSQDRLDRGSNEYGSANNRQNLFDDSLNTTNDVG